MQKTAATRPVGGRLALLAALLLVIPLGALPAAAEEAATGSEPALSRSDGSEPALSRTDAKVAATTGAAPRELAPEEFHDPWERYNRAIFRFNDGLSRMVAEPVGRAWRWTVPEILRTAMRNFFVNLAFPIRVVNTTLQLKPLATGQEILRFAVNCTFGIAGTVDVATRGVGLPLHREDFGQTLGYWGVGEGPYFMIPIFGPSNVRDTVGLGADIATGAATFSLIGISVPFFATFAAQAGNFINSQSFVVDEVDRERTNSLDFYASVRSAYLQFRRARVADYDLDDDPAEAEEDLYYFEDDLYGDDLEDAPSEATPAPQETP